MPELTKPIEQLEKEAKASLVDRVAQVREMRTNALLNQGRVKKGNPDKVYIWLHDSAARRAYYEGMGYQMTRDPKVETNHLWKQADGTHKRGDLVLYEIDKDLYEAIKMEAQIRSVENVEGSRDGFIAFANKAGIPVEIPNSK